MDVVFVFLGDFIAALFGSIASRKVLAEGGKPSGAVASMARAASQLQAHWYPSNDDEAAFLLALADLTPGEQVTISRRIRDLGNPKIDDTPEARIFRKVLVTIPTQEERVRTLRSFVELKDDDWKRVVRITGAASPGQFKEAVKEYATWAQIKFQAFWNKISSHCHDADHRAAERIDSAAAFVSSLRQRVRP